MGRGDRRVAGVVRRAWELGATNDSWWGRGRGRVRGRVRGRGRVWVRVARSVLLAAPQPHMDARLCSQPLAVLCRAVQAVMLTYIPCQWTLARSHLHPSPSICEETRVGLGHDDTPLSPPRCFALVRFSLGWYLRPPTHTPFPSPPASCRWESEERAYSYWCRAIEEAGMDWKYRQVGRARRRMAGCGRLRWFCGVAACGLRLAPHPSPRVFTGHARTL